eukprot:1083682-Rhodomonas_salina.1
MRCPVLRSRMVLPACARAAHGVRYGASAYRRLPYAMRGTERARMARPGGSDKYFQTGALKAKGAKMANGATYWGG